MNDVLYAICRNSLSIMDGWIPTPSTVIAEELGMSVYQVRKELKRLKELGLVVSTIYDQKWQHSMRFENLVTGFCKIIKLPKSILDDVEKEYLGNIIKPFRDRIICIKKYEDPQDEYIGIHLKYYANETDSETIVFPSFGKRTMYKGMEVEKEYTLEELGL